MPVGAGLAIAGAGAAYSANRSSSAAGRANRTANRQAAASQRLIDQTDPLRQALIDRSADFLGIPDMMAMNLEGGTGDSFRDRVLARAAGLMPQQPSMRRGMPPGGVLSSPTYLAYKDTTERNFDDARDRVVATVPRGGALVSALTNLEGDRASTLTQGAGQVYENELARALSLSTGLAPVALNTLGQAGNSQALLAGAQAQQSSAKAQSLGSAAGSYLGSK